MAPEPVTHFRKIMDGIDVGPLREQIRTHKDLWNAHANRTGFAGSPFEDTSDMWLRYRAIEDLKERRDFLVPHFAVNYPSWYALPAAHDIVFDLMRAVRAVHLGGVLLTKIPAGGRVAPHDDRGSWHAETMDCKVYVPIEANDQCVNYCGDESLVIKVGEAVEFNNLVRHSVENNGDTPRVTLIICMKRCEPVFARPADIG